MTVSWERIVKKLYVLSNLLRIILSGNFLQLYKINIVVTYEFRNISERFFHSTSISCNVAQCGMQWTKIEIIWCCYLMVSLVSFILYRILLSERELLLYKREIIYNKDIKYLTAGQFQYLDIIVELFLS